jgi:toxin ParE1/3/4
VSIKWLLTADHEFESQLRYVAERNLSAATKMRERIQTAVELLVDQPNAGRLGRVSGTRELVVVGTPYVIAYRVRPPDVQILRILHGAQRWPDRI